MTPDADPTAAPPTTPLPVCMLWVGGALGPIERLSLVSFLTNGHPVALYTYADVTGIPPGIERRDAREVMPEAVVAALRYANGSVALASNLFRYRLLAAGKGLWADIDVVCLKPVPGGKPAIVGWEGARYLNGAVLYLHRDLPIVAEAMALFDAGAVPPWLPWRKRVRPLVRRALGHRLRPTDFPHGTFGPKAVTALVAKHGLTALAEPPEVFYPLAPRQARRAFDADLSLDAVATERSLTLHLWNEKIRDLKATRPAPGSILATLYHRYGV
jgi:hypothetical protein